MSKMNINFFLTFILLLPVIYCNKDHHEDQDGSDKKNWMQFLPNHVQHILKSKITTTSTAVSDDEISSNSTESLIPGELLMNSSDTPEIMYGNSGSDSSTKSFSIGFSVGGVILFICICCICYKCCCSSRANSQGIVIQPMPPPPPPQDLNQPNIVIQHIHPTPQYHPGMVQHVHQTHAPPPMVTSPQFQQPPPYPVGYEERQMLQQEWSPHSPMHQQQQQQHYPAPDYPYNPSAPPPSYGKY